MSKTKTLFTMALLVLLGSMGAAQAQEHLRHNQNGHPTPNRRPDGWRKRDVRERLAHFFQRARSS